MVVHPVFIGHENIEVSTSGRVMNCPSGKRTLLHVGSRSEALRAALTCMPATLVKEGVCNGRPECRHFDVWKKGRSM